METEVMPWAAIGSCADRRRRRPRRPARPAMAPDAAARDWRMPAVAALPEPEVRRFANLQPAWTRRCATPSTATSPSQQAGQGRLHARGRHARHGAAAPSARLRLHADLQLQPHAPRVRLLPLPSGELTVRVARFVPARNCSPAEHSRSASAHRALSVWIMAGFSRSITRPRCL